VTRSASGSRVPALIFGADIGPLGVLRRLATRGIPCLVADETTDMITRSRWYRAPRRTISETADSVAVADYLRSLDLERAVLIGSSDRWALAVAGLPDDLRDRFMISAPSRKTIEQFVDKDKFRALVERVGTPAPRSLHLNGPQDLDLLTDTELQRGFFKPTDSQLHRDHFRTKGSFTTSRDEARRLLEQAAAAGVALIYQEWIPGPMSATLLFDGFMDRHCTIRGVIARRRLRVHPEPIGNTVSSVTIPLGEVREPLERLRQLLTAVDYRGAFNAEFKLDGADGQFKILEVNARPAWYAGTIASAGVDIPWMVYLDAQGLPVPDATEYRVGRYEVVETRDARAIMAALRTRTRPSGPVLVPWLLGDRTHFWWSDPLPAFNGVARAVGRLFGRGRRARMETGRGA
jgi:predicted ATP-grasp superfamily ATP-dependent carboligase